MAAILRVFGANKETGKRNILAYTLTKDQADKLKDLIKQAKEIFK
jgi:hypothetical protein